MIRRAEAEIRKKKRGAAAKKREAAANKRAAEGALDPAKNVGDFRARVNQTAEDINTLMGDMPGARRKKKAAGK